jgi:tryptophan-rich sensory protein
MNLSITISLFLSCFLACSAAFQTVSTSNEINQKVRSVKPSHVPGVSVSATSQNKKQETNLFAATGESSTGPEIDVDAIVKYGVSIAIQMSLITGLFYGLDTVVDTFGVEVPFPAVSALFYFFSLKSRTFNPLNNQRPNLEKGDKPTKGFRDRVMPSWTPPGVIFPIMWVLIIGPIRSYTSALVYTANGHHFCDIAILSLMLHLSIGDVWNTINNTEKRYGAAVPSVLLVSAAAASAAYQYSLVDPIAGKLLGGTLVWFTVASTLITDTWRLNPDPVTGERDSLYPVTGGESKTEFAWFGGDTK